MSTNFPPNSSDKNRIAKVCKLCDNLTVFSKFSGHFYGAFEVLVDKNANKSSLFTKF